MAPSGRARPSPFDRFADGSASAIASGFSAALALGPQPKVGDDGLGEGADWLRSLRQVSGMYDGSPETEEYIGHRDTRNLHGDEDGSDDEDVDSEGDSPAQGKKRAKNSKAGGSAKKAGKGGGDSAAALRKAQNRLAQREFRQRKQQYIRALEARVELLSSDHDTQVDRLRYALRALLAENNHLRQIVASFASFVGTQQIGGPLQKSGISRKQLEDLMCNSSEKLMTETWQNWPGATECEALRQIRLESNLPPEGLPESTRLPEHARVNTEATRAEAASKGEGGSSTPGKSANGSEATQSKKRKASRDSFTTGRGGRRDRSGPNGPTTMAAGQAAEATADTPDAVIQQQQPAGAGVSNRVAPPVSEANGQALESFFAAGGQQFFQTSPGMSSAGYTFTPPTFGGMQQSSTNAQPQDSNAILASLFGPSGMTGFVGNGPGQVPSPFAMGAGQGETDTHGGGMSGQYRQRTIANANEPEEIRRIGVLVDRLKRERERFGSGKAAEELSQIGNALYDLTRQMASFRRQPSYQLPLLLEPSEIQQTRPHDPLIDALPFPGVRQNIIAQQDSLVIEDIVLSILHFSNLHPGDITDKNNWELLYGFLIAYPQLVDQNTLDIANRWRATRKEPILTFDDIAPGHA